jgi:N6-L-threonylcarbamoyladenine synthase
MGGPGVPPLPFVSLVVSGGHTHLYRVEGLFSFRCLGATLDDAAGEAYDKVAKMLGLGYPGGPILDALAGEAEGEPSIQFPRPLLDDGGLNFSFSGLKTAVLYFLMDHGLYLADPAVPPLERARGIGGDLLRQIACAFQAAVAEVLTEKALRAVRREGCQALAVVGGVAAHRGLRARLRTRSAEEGVALYVPAPSFCTDNAAMIAAAGYFLLKAGRGGGPEALRLDADAAWELQS